MLSDRELMKKRGDLLNQAPKKFSREERMRTFDLEAYFLWLEENRRMIEKVKGIQPFPPADGIERGHARAKALGLLQRGKIELND